MNQTMVTYFIIQGISDTPTVETLIFLLVLLIYIITLGGNMTILLLICLDHQLHTPMYFFLGNLSIIDMCSTTVTLHKILSSFILGNKTISFVGCMAQFYFYATLTCDELLILMTMSYDRYVAICNPLHYHMVMSRRVCVFLASFCWMLGFIESAPHLVILSCISCYKSKEINHFFCDIWPIIRLSCSDTSLLYILIYLCASILSIFPPLLTFIPYGFIIFTVLRIPSKRGRRKAFYTCSSHLTVVMLLYVTLICQYMTPSSMDSLDFNKCFSLFNTAAVPLLNPLIYSLKNQDVKTALKRRIRW
ncbi:olfactory receptor 2AP1-like [Discoglossus pictus]